jgi:hypothetical protein
VPHREVRGRRSREPRPQEGVDAGGHDGVQTSVNVDAMRRHNEEESGEVAIATVFFEHFLCKIIKDCIEINSVQDIILDRAHN